MMENMLGKMMKAQFHTLRTNLTVRAVRVKVIIMRTVMIEMTDVTTTVVMRWSPILVIHLMTSQSDLSRLYKLYFVWMAKA